MEVQDKHAFANSLRERLQRTDQLPSMPEVACELMRLRNKPDVNLNELINIINRDPGIAAQVLRYSRMASFGYGERITSVRDAVSLVLGFNSALHMTLGLACGKTFKTPNTGPLARTVLWRQALSTATLSQSLASMMPSNQRPSRDVAYLSGLMHNFGLLLFGHWYPEHYEYLNRMAEAHMHEKIRDIELYAFGISHDIIGSALMQAWNMPEEIVVAISENHFPDYQGKHWVYPRLVAVSNRLLGYPGMKDGCTYMDTKSLLDSLHLSEEQASKALEQVKGCQPDFQQIAQAMAA